MRQTQEILQATKRASAALAQITSDEKNAVLLAMADALQASCDTILAENQKDLQQARGVISDVGSFGTEQRSRFRYGTRDSRRCRLA